MTKKKKRKGTTKGAGKASAKKRPGSSQGRILRRALGVIVVSVILVGAVLGLRAWLTPKPQPETQDAQAQDTDPKKGAAAGSVTIREFSDFQCPACGHAQPLLDQVLARYPDEVNLEYENFPLPGHQWAALAAQAGECAYDQDKFWEFHDLLFDQQSLWSESSNPRNLFKSMADSSGLDAKTFTDCLESSQAKEKVERDLQEGHDLNVRSTPTFFVNGEKVVGLRELSDLTDVINKELKDRE